METVEGPGIVTKPERHCAGLDWVREQKLVLDCVEDPAGDRFGCRYEAYRTDPRSERMKTRWQIELAIRLADPAL